MLVDPTKRFRKAPHVGHLGFTRLSLRWLSCMLLLGCVTTALAQQQVLKPRQQRGTGIQMVARMSKQPLHIVRSSDNRLFCTLYSEETRRTELVEIMQDATTRPFPNEEWNKPRQPNGLGITEIVGLAIGPNGYLAIMDRGNSTYRPRVVIWDLKADKVVYAREFSSVVTDQTHGRLLQDLAIDTKNKCIYAAAASENRKSGTIIVAAFETGQMRTFSVAAAVQPISEAKPTAPELDTLRTGLNIPITIDPDLRWVYFGTPDGQRIFRISAEILASPQLTQAEFATAVQEYGEKQYSAHIAADSQGAVYCAEVNDTKIGVITPSRKYRTFVNDKLLDRPYGLAVGRDGYLYISVNQISTLDRGHAPVSAERPYLITRTALGSLQ